MPGPRNGTFNNAPLNPNPKWPMWVQPVTVDQPVVGELPPEPEVLVIMAPMIASG